MSTLVQSRPHAMIAEDLRQPGWVVREVGVDSWRLWCTEDPNCVLDARLSDAFLMFDAPAPVPHELSLSPSWLGWNSSFAGNAKIVLVPGPSRVRLRAELAVDADAAAALRINFALSGIREALRRLAAPSDPPMEGSSPPVANATDAACSLGDFLREAGRSFQARSDGTLSVELPVRGDSCRASLSATTYGIRVAVDLLQADGFDPRCRLAVSVFLLSVGGVVRLVRPFAAAAGASFSCGLEVQLSSDVSAVELDHALEALAVGCWACKVEVQSLLHFSVAEQYLAIQTV